MVVEALGEKAVLTVERLWELTPESQEAGCRGSTGVAA